MTVEYDRPSPPSGAVRLHLNERTDGCSTRALAALRALTAAAAGQYPDYGEVVEAVGRHFRLPASQFVLTNGLDEGLHAAATLALRPRVDTPSTSLGAGPSTSLGAGEAIVIEPAFDMYEVVTAAMAGRVVRLEPLPDLSPGIARVRAATTPRTRIVFINTPMNPTGLEIPAEAIVEVARRAPEALVFVDEAYVEFGGEGSLLDDQEIGSDGGAWRLPPNLLVGRTFAKAYGLAGLRAGLVAGAPEVIGRLKAIVPPYSLNAAVTAMLPAALRDVRHLDEYVRQVRQSRDLLYAAFDRAGFPYWKSGGNFVLVRPGEARPRLLAALAAHGIAVRDRTAGAGLHGCVRVTAGRIVDTMRVLTAMGDLSCDAR